MEYQGKLLIANPKLVDSTYSRCVYIIVDNNKANTVGICINKPFENGATFGNVMSGIGLSSDYDQVPLYFGGHEVNNRVFMIHSLDWTSSTTKQLNSQIGMTTDISILAAIGQNEGPEYFRPCVGFIKWPAGQIDLEIANKNSIWSITDATMDLCFGIDDSLIWAEAITEATREQVNAWF